MVELKEVPAPTEVEAKPDLTPEQKLAVEKRIQMEVAVQAFVIDKIKRSGEWWFNTRNIVGNTNLDIIGGHSFEPMLKEVVKTSEPLTKEFRLYVGADWVPAKKAKK